MVTSVQRHLSKLHDVPDDTDEPAGPDSRTSSHTSPLSWPLVERRHGAYPPPGGLERRGDRPAAAPTDALTLSAAPLWPFRLAALAGAAIRSYNDLSWTLLVFGVVIVVYNIVTSIRPVPYRNDNKIRLRIVVEQSIHAVAILATGAWASPFVLCLIPTSMLAGFAAGGVFSAELAAASVAAITVQNVPEFGVQSSVQVGAVWAALLTLLAITTGLAHRASFDAVRQQRVALDRVSMLAEANSLLFALQRVAQTLPASLDLDEVLDSTVSRVRAMIDYDTLVVYLVSPIDQRIDPIRTQGLDHPPGYSFDQLPTGLRSALESARTVRLDSIADGKAISPHGRSGLYSSLHARGVLVGMLAVESDHADGFGQQQAEIVHGLAEPFGIAIDNARMFRQIRTLAADEERSRIARDLHDHIGSSLALIGFEVDRASSVAREGGALEPVLHELREHVTAVVTDVRETLFDLRTEITDQSDFRRTLTDYLSRVQQRSGILTAHDVHIDGRLPLLQERELWQIAREAVTNTERHSGAKHLEVTVYETADSALLIVHDDGVGIEGSQIRADSYGMIGMRERASRIGAELTVRVPSKGGTEIRVELLPAGGSRQWD